MSYWMKFKWQNPNVKSNPKPQCQNVFQNDQLFFSNCSSSPLKAAFKLMGGHIFLICHLTFTLFDKGPLFLVNLNLFCPLRQLYCTIKYWQSNRVNLKFQFWSLSFKFTLFTYFDPFIKSKNIIECQSCQIGKSPCPKDITGKMPALHHPSDSH